MITVRKSGDRLHELAGLQEIWHTFKPDAHAGPEPGTTSAWESGFGLLESLQESEIEPLGFLLRHAQRDAVILTFVQQGALVWEDSLGGSGLVRTGEFWRMTSGRGVIYREANASRTHPVRVVQLWLSPPRFNLKTSHEHKHFTAAERRGALCLIATADGRDGSLAIHQDAMVYSALLEAGTHIAHALEPGRNAWLHVLDGEVTLGDQILSAGDGAGFVDELVVSFRTRNNTATEILLIDLGPSRNDRVRQTSRRRRLLSLVEENQPRGH